MIYAWYDMGLFNNKTYKTIKKVCEDSKILYLLQN